MRVSKGHSFSDDQKNENQSSISVFRFYSACRRRGGVLKCPRFCFFFCFFFSVSKVGLPNRGDICLRCTKIALAHESFCYFLIFCFFCCSTCKEIEV